MRRDPPTRVPPGRRPLGPRPRAGRRPATEGPRRGPAGGPQELHPDLARRRPEPPGDVRPETRRPGRGPRPASPYRDERARAGDRRAFRAAGPRDGPGLRDPLDDL